ncbi:hypothetical protein QZL56_19505 [Providencia stuartii]|nr:MULTISPECIES: hypothetical protein [Providencia]MDN7225418.1 hypothetical protein [Providencia stuartii]MDQ5991966.1 hypothetical protein [Providencia stuartii]
MKILFSQIYAEIDTSYDITNSVLIPLKNNLDALDKNIIHYEKLFKTNDYSVVFIITSTRGNSPLVKGPTTLSKKKKVEFVIFIPYKESTSFTERICHAIDYIEKGIIFVFDKYKSDSSGVKEVFEELKALIINDPEKYQQWIKWC